MPGRQDVNFRTATAAMAAATALLAGPAGASAQVPQGGIGTAASTALSSGKTVKAVPSCDPATLGTQHQRCVVKFSDGPRVRLGFDQNGGTVTVSACAYGHRPAHLGSLSFDSSAS